MIRDILSQKTWQTGMMKSYKLLLMAGNNNDMNYTLTYYIGANHEYQLNSAITSTSTTAEHLILRVSTLRQSINLNVLY